MTDKQRILVVDDTPSNILVLNEHLTNQYRISVATNGPAALKLSGSKNPPDLILLDIMMPEMDGYEVCRQLKSNSETCDIPVIFLTSKTETEAIVKGFKAGAVDYVTKPFNEEELLSRIDTHLQLKKARETIEKDTIEIGNLNNHLREKNIELIALNASMEDMVKQRTIELEEANKRLKSLNNEKMAFIRYLSHEMNTPLNCIAAANVIDKDALSDSNLEMIEMIEEGFRRLNQFVKKVIDYFILAGDQTVYQQGVVALERVVGNVLKDIRNTADAKNISFEIIYGEEIHIAADKNYLHELILILVENAIIYSQPGSKVIIETINENDIPVLRVIDTGKGIKKENLGAIFTPFVIESFDRHDGGHGLNLPKAKVIAEAHGWSIYAESNGIGNGASLNVVFR